MKPSRGAWRECEPGEKLSQLVETLGELKRSAWSQTLGEAAEKRMPDRRGYEDMVKGHSYPINKLFTHCKNRRAGPQQGLMLWRNKAVLPWESSVGLEGSGEVLPKTGYGWLRHTSLGQG